MKLCKIQKVISIICSVLGFIFSLDILKEGLQSIWRLAPIGSLLYSAFFFCITYNCIRFLNNSW